MDLGLNDTVVLITGGSKGIGLACAQGFAAEGARVAIASRQREHLEQANATLQAVGVQPMVVAADLGDPEQAARMVREVESRLGPVGV
ncbi:MAG: 3-oxoacyl-ACP reductase, partial [Thiomonas sp. 14-66-4]